MRTRNDECLFCKSNLKADARDTSTSHPCFINSVNCTTDTALLNDYSFK